MNLNDLLRVQGFDPRNVLVRRHRPNEPELNKVLPWLASEEPDVFNAYQQTQGQVVSQNCEELFEAISAAAISARD